jgi:hypothetical protein
MVSAGSTLSFDARGTAGGWLPVTVDSVRQDISDALAGYFLVQSVTVNNQGSFYELEQWQYVARITVRTREAYGAVDDAGSIVAHAVYDATGYLPTVGAVGSQGASGVPSGGGIADTIADAFKGITGELNTTLVIVGLVLVAGVFVLSGKTTRVGI